MYCIHHISYLLSLFLLHNFKFGATLQQVDINFMTKHFERPLVQVLSFENVDLSETISPITLETSIHSKLNYSSDHKNCAYCVHEFLCRNAQAHARESTTIPLKYLSIVVILIYPKNKTDILKGYDLYNQNQRGFTCADYHLHPGTLKPQRIFYKNAYIFAMLKTWSMLNNIPHLLSLANNIYSPVYVGYYANNVTSPIAYRVLTSDLLWVLDKLILTKRECLLFCKTEYGALQRS